MITYNMIVRGLLLNIFIVAALSLGNLAEAALIVNRSIITFENPAVNREDVVVINSSADENLYVQIDPFTVINPGNDQQELVPLLVDDNPEFLVTPNRLVVSPNGRSVVRFLNLLPAGDSERVYRINMVPITPPVELGGGEQDDFSSRLEVVVAYQILVIVLPASPTPEMSMNREGSVATFGNTGNANYLLTDGVQCNPANAEDCVPLEDRRIYPGNRWQLELPFNGPFTYKIRTQNGLTTEYFQ